jgi:hypothetical protein
MSIIVAEPTTSIARFLAQQRRTTLKALLHERATNDSQANVLPANKPHEQSARGLHLVVQQMCL